MENPTYAQHTGHSAYPAADAVYNLGHILARNASPCGFPDRTAIIDADQPGGRRITYRELNERSNRCAHALRGLGITKGDRVFVLMSNRPETVEVVYGCLKSGAVYTPANFRLSAEEISFLVEDMEASTLIFDSDFAGTVHSVAGRLSALKLVEVGSRQVEGALDYEDLLEQASMEDPNVDTAPDDTCMILFTAGTTGRPKGVCLTHRSTFFACLSNGISASLTPDDVYLGAPPMFHCGGLTCFQLYMLMIAGTIVLQARWTAKGALDAIKAHGVTYHFGIATQLKFMVQENDWASCVGTLRAVNGGGEPQPAELKQAFINQGITYVSGYGLTETGATGFNWAASSPSDPTLSKASECMGKPPAFVEVKIVDPNGEEVPAGETGEIIIRREPTGAAGYWKRPDDEAKKFRGDWIFTGDLGKSDEEGYYYVLGRTDDMIVSGGENIYPSEIERVIYGHEKVADVVVVRGTHPQWGQTPKAIVVPKPGQTVTEEEIVDLVGAHLASFKKPRKIVIVESVPRSETGKIDKRAIKELYEER